MKSSKKFISVITVLSMLMCMLSVCASVFTLPTFTVAHAESETVGGNCGYLNGLVNASNATWSLDTDTGVLEITGTGETASYSSSSAPWSAYGNTITQVVVKDGITKLGNYSFNNCASLVSATLPDSLLELGSYAFSNTSSLENVDFGNSITKIGLSAFENSSAIRK